MVVAVKYFNRIIKKKGTYSRILVEDNQEEKGFVKLI